MSKLEASTVPRVDFYILADDAMTDKYAYACRLANKAYAQGLTVYMQTEAPAQNELLNKMLWTFSQSSFVPHAICDADGAAHDIERYPVQIGCGAPPPACAGLLISFAREAASDYARFGRVAELIINQEDDKACGRRRYQFYRQQGIAPHTHQIA